MPNLEKLTLRFCELLRKMPSGIGRLSSPRGVVYEDIPGELSLRLNQDSDAMTSHIKKVFVKCNATCTGTVYKTFTKSLSDGSPVRESIREMLPGADLTASNYCRKIGYS